MTKDTQGPIQDNNGKYCGTEWVHSTTLLRPLFTYFLFRHSWDRKYGYWCKICTVPQSVCVMPNPLAKTWDSNSGSQSMYATGLPTQPYKGRNSVVLCTHSVPQLAAIRETLVAFRSPAGEKKERYMAVFNTKHCQIQHFKPSED